MRNSSGVIRTRLSGRSVMHQRLAGPVNTTLKAQWFNG
jgi:hypothetical protein